LLNELLGYFRLGKVVLSRRRFSAICAACQCGGSNCHSDSLRFEARTVFRRREAEGSIQAGESAALCADIDLDVARSAIILQDVDPNVEREFVAVLESCFSQTPPVFIRTIDALHLASAKVAGESEFITADFRQRAAAQLIGFAVRP
jgi:predicted nucleic acid-binding protein